MLEVLKEMFEGLPKEEQCIILHQLVESIMSKEEQATLINELTKEMTIEEKANRIAELKTNIAKLITIIDNYTEVERRIYRAEEQAGYSVGCSVFFCRPSLYYPKKRNVNCWW